ncbi:MAG: RNA polymerase sigma-70 factor [Bacteroidales bacterium]|nr:RNA polymerase sigma-70 factor [Bacteroidales bacterium]MCF8398458.1 RNA polymerase sigma-70 factor [Bacteroidales bacterium]
MQFAKQHFEQVFKDHYKGMVFFALRYVKDHDTAEEIAQEAFMALWEKRTDINISNDVKSYLTASVRNKCLNHLRDHKKFNRDLLELEGLAVETENDSSQVYEMTELKEKIEDLISDLPVKCREVFILNRFEGLKYREVSEKLGISVKTVETQMSKALQYLRHNLKKYMMILLL